MNDLVADALIRIKNGYLSRKEAVSVPYSKLNLAICQLLSKEGYLASAKQDGHAISVQLFYGGSSAKKEPALSDVKRISKPGLRVYKSKKTLPWVLNGLGIAIISTPKGIMSDAQARKEGVGGEVLAYVW